MLMHTLLGKVNALRSCQWRTIFRSEKGEVLTQRLMVSISCFGEILNIISILPFYLNIRSKFTDHIQSYRRTLYLRQYEIHFV